MRSKSQNLSHEQVPADILSINRQESYFRNYFQWLTETQPQDPAARQVMIVARSPESPTLLAIRALSAELAEHDVVARVVFSDIEPESSLKEAWRVIGDLCDASSHHELVRWVSAQGFLEAHEQMILGGKMCWLGDVMRREAGRKDAFDVFETSDTKTCLFAVKNFSAIWNMATGIPSWMLREDSDRRAGASHSGPDAKSLATLSFFNQLDKPETRYH